MGCVLNDLENPTPGGASLFYVSKSIYLGVLKKGGGGGYPQALLEGLASEARY